MPIVVNDLYLDPPSESGSDDGSSYGGSSMVNPDGTLVDHGVRFDITVDDGTPQGCRFKLLMNGWTHPSQVGDFVVMSGNYLNILAWSSFGRYERYNNCVYFFSDAQGKVAKNKADFFLRNAAAYATDNRPDTGTGNVMNPRNTGWAGTMIKFKRTDPSWARQP